MQKRMIVVRQLALRKCKDNHVKAVLPNYVKDTNKHNFSRLWKLGKKCHR